MIAPPLHGSQKKHNLNASALPRRRRGSLRRRANSLGASGIRDRRRGTRNRGRLLGALGVGRSGLGATEGTTTA